MSELYQKSINKLELPLVLERLAECASSAGGKQACLQLMPSFDLETVQELLQQTTDAYNLSTKRGNPMFSDVTDVSAALERADMGGSLQPIELLRIAGVLRSARTVKGYLSEDGEKTLLDELIQGMTPN